MVTIDLFSHLVYNIIVIRTNNKRKKIVKNHFSTTIENANRIAVFSHINPDADALCSSIALKNMLTKTFPDKEVDVFTSGEIGELYSHIVNNEPINISRGNYDLAFVLDCPNLQRCGDWESLASQIPNIINIDHHETNCKFGTFNIVSNTVSSTCELIYRIAKAQKFNIDDTDASLLYQGIITDTNNFMSQSITPFTHKAVSDLLGYNFDVDEVKDHYFNNNSKAKDRLLIRALLSLRFYNNGTFTTMKIDNESFKQLGATFDDTLGIIDNGMNISQSKVSAILIEKEPNYIHCSLRSLGDVNVGEIAQLFNGGGSKTVAAFQINGDMKEVEQHLVTAISPKLPTNENETIYDNDFDMLF